MNQRLAPLRYASMAAHEGLHFLSAPEIMIKHALESDTPVSLIAGPRHDPFVPVFEIAESSLGKELLARHETEVLATHDAVRAIRLTLYAARAGNKAIALVPNGLLDQTIAALMQSISEPLESEGAVCLVLEDHPELAPASCPRRAAMRLGIACLEVTDTGRLGASIDVAMRLSRAGRRPVALVIHTSILRSASTLEVHANRVAGPTEILLPRRRGPRPRWGEAGGVLRMARRLEVNRFRAMPSPGERIPLGFITVGPAEQAMHHIAQVFKLHGRIPILQLGLVHPLDEPVVGRLLTRCDQVVVLEPRPGTIELGVLQLAERLRHRGEQTATVWGRQLPPDDEGHSAEMNSDEDLHPSVLVRKITHLLQRLWAGAEIRSVLVPDPPDFEIELPPRSAVIGSDAAMNVIRDLLGATNRWLMDEAPLEERNVADTQLAIDGNDPETPASRIVQVETWGHRRFHFEGISALIQAAHDKKPWVFIVCESAQPDGRDFERLARSAVPADRAARVRIETGNLDDQTALEEKLHEAVLSDGLTVLIVRDGPPARYDVLAIEASMQEIDRLGFQTTQRFIRPIESACTLHVNDPNVAVDQSDGRQPKALETNVTVDQQSRRGRSGMKSRLRPLFEQIEVIRMRPPARIWRNAPPSRLPLPKPIHGTKALWRAHLSGFRSQPPGVAAMVLCEAGRRMGYAVQSIYNPTPIGAGRRAWAEILFTHVQQGEVPSEYTATIPYGEADVILGMDAQETFRTIGPDPALRVIHAARTCAVVNIGHYQDEREDDKSNALRERLTTWLESNIPDQSRFVRDFVKACRRSFGSDRLVDLALLGAAYQLGYVPVTFDAINEAVNRVESQGYGSVADAFEFGRRLVLNPTLFARQRDEREEGIRHIARRLELMLARAGWGRRIRASRFHSLVDRSLKAMPGLAETDAGRQSRRLFVMALYHCMLWGGFDYAERFTDLVIQLYHADRGDKARNVTRLAILPMAEVMLIRDPVYVASMVCSPAQRRRTRQRLNAKLARGDRIELRYLTRFELTFRERRIRIDLRSSDWAVRSVASIRKFLPQRWRGGSRARELREFVLEFVRRATLTKMPDYELASRAFQTLHELAASDRLRGMTARELQRQLDVSFDFEEPGPTPDLSAARPE